ncbi:MULTISPECIES: hypothetical protein [Euryhalocaulis]|uniref:hypothetical protein n=1 Tax=Euryhalocaulis TaxID=1712422 RepID=UPI0003AA55C1|nr:MULTISPECIES: hypothetical protein [Euryhalocaulis]MBA4801113.1 hypothetical protein [Euryhalocaulis sp.]
MAIDPEEKAADFEPDADFEVSDIQVEELLFRVRNVEGLLHNILEELKKQAK